MLSTKNLLRWLPSRLRRRQFWLWTTVTWIVFFAMRELLGLEHSSFAATLWAALALTVILVLIVARLHDRNRSAWWLLIAALPIAGAVWLAWETAFRCGTPDRNQFGEMPVKRLFK